MIDVRGDFPLLKNHPKLVYLDSACTSLKPSCVIGAEAGYYERYGSCAGRSAHSLGRKTTQTLDEARREVASFVNGDPEALVWTRNTTEALNLIASSFDLKSRRKVVTGSMEHHAALLPLLRMEEEGRADLTILEADERGRIGLEAWQEAIDDETALVLTNCGTNTTGASEDITQIAKIAHERGARLCVDGAQGAPHHRIDMKRMGADFFCFSAHKMCGPTGIGAMIATAQSLDALGNYMVGGGTVRTLSGKEAVYMEGRERFEAGIQDYAGIFGFAQACRYLRGIGMEKVEAHERALGALMREALEGAGAIIYGPLEGPRSATYAFNLKRARAHEVALMLDKQDIAVRSGFFCAQPAMEAMGAKDGAVRASAYIYNDGKDIARFADALAKLAMIYG